MLYKHFKGTKVDDFTISFYAHLDYNMETTVENYIEITATVNKYVLKNVIQIFQVYKS